MTDHDPNAKYRIATFTVENTTIRVYLLNPGEAFERFGGLQRSLPVTKTASLIVSTSDHRGRKDMEYDLRGQSGDDMWGWIFDICRQSAAK
jgi:hypothetical protein